MSQRAGNAVAGDTARTNLFAEFAYQHAFWRVREPLASAVAFMKEHPPTTFTFRGAEHYSVDPYANVWFDGPSAGGRVPARINVELVRFAGAIIIRGDAGVPWTYPRSARELVPAMVREIDLNHTGGWHALLGAEPHMPRQVTDPRKVALIVRWFNALNVAPHLSIGCPGSVVTYVQLTFRSAAGAAVATAFVPGAPASFCTWIGFAVPDGPKAALVDSTPFGGMSFAERLVRLLGR